MGGGRMWVQCGGFFFLLWGVKTNPAGKYTGLLFCQIGPFQLRFLGNFGAIGVNRRPLRASGNFVYKLVLRGQHHVSGAKQRIPTGSKHRDLCVSSPKTAMTIGAFASAYPTSLQRYDR